MRLVRFARFDDRTIGRLEVENETFWTIENPWLGNAPNVSCIPDGHYQMERYDSPSRGPNTWQLVEVPDRTYIQIHVANYATDVLGCIGLGTSLLSDLAGVGNSRNAMDRFHQITDGLTESEIQIYTDKLSVYEY